jgi:hypothetical protein
MRRRRGAGFSLHGIQSMTVLGKWFTTISFGTKHCGMQPSWAFGQSDGPVGLGARVIGSGVDTAVQGKKLLTPGETAEITDRMAFSWALAVYGALAGTVLTYLSTGHRPKDLKHAYYWLRADGSYDAIPGYPKNVIAMYEHPIDAIGNKLSPIIEAFEEAIHNEDFYHVEIRHKDDPILKQFGEFASWAAKLAATPFSFSGTQKMLENKGEDASVDWRHPIESAKRIGGEVAKHTGDLIAGNLGFQPAPAYIQNSEALNMAREYERENAPPGTKTQDQAEHSKALHSVEDQYRTKNVDKAQILQMIKDGKLTEAEWFKAQMRSGQNPLAAAVRNLSIEQALNVYAAATPEEKKAIALQVERKAAKITTDPSLSAEKRQELQKSYKVLFHIAQPFPSYRGATGS